MDYEAMKVSVDLWKSTSAMQSLEVHRAFCKIIQTLAVDEDAEIEHLTEEEGISCKTLCKEAISMLESMENSITMFKKGLGLLHEDIELNMPKSENEYLN